MVSSTIRRMYDLMHPPKRLNCSQSLWITILHELRERGRDNRESGGFLLGRIEGELRFISEFMAYDDIDPNALQGIIVFDASRMDLVWARCEAQGLQVVADVHTHPGDYGQSHIDQAHPMIPQRGHLALIVPDFAKGRCRPGNLGMYEYRGRDGWFDHSSLGSAFFRLGWF